MSIRSGRTENQVFSTRVARAEFDGNWTTSISISGYVIYAATKNKATITVLLTNGEQRLITFPKGGKVFVGSGGVSHYSKPHTVKNIQG
ncbi:hypothetical protein FHS18_002226 [Paenibacillus phyllosphaerae]|uniref:Uncharacterized protein n=1 Tax=Paenibacillus phyllosphaerae TaxID=274593 RepID=A0A7W5FMM5_9BACL|nr:hypothetical protein [Paenibacillus phyllosphaerae]MBB3110159.1 hypothetical protein [Paenibacillus phyllosphaerae]